jgi:uncharacterized membrane protein YdjX (TVP38/TMEM64 family)
MARLVRLSLIISLALLVPVVPFLLFGERLDSAVQQWLRSDPSQTALEAIVVAVLASDIVLPVPSSFVNTWAGAQLGIVRGAVCAFAGLSLGSVAGFAVAGCFGYPVAHRLASVDDLRRMELVSEQYGWLVLIATRPLPVLAEATVLVLGATGLAWRSFLPALLLSNLALATGYAALGAATESSGQLFVVLALSVAVPIAATAIVRRWIAQRQNRQS